MVGRCSTLARLVDLYKNLAASSQQDNKTDSKLFGWRRRREREEEEEEEVVQSFELASRSLAAVQVYIYAKLQFNFSSAAKETRFESHRNVGVAVVVFQNKD